MKKIFHALSLAVGLGMAGGTFCALGATANVSIGDDFFSPTNITINVGDSIIWTWVGSISHSSTSDTGDTTMWNSGVHAGGLFSFTNQFPGAGTFTYHCNIHSFMMARVVVQAPAAPPTIAITSPTNGAILSAPASTMITATAGDTGGIVTNVQFLNGAISLGNVAAAPYTVSQNSLTAGDYTISAIAANNAGLTATNSIILHVVTPIPIILSSALLAPPNFRFTYSANIGLKYVIAQSTNLSVWTVLGTNTAAGTAVTFTDSNAPAGLGFYRVGLAPNP